MSQAKEKPKAPMPQQQEKPGLESKMHPRPQYQAPHYKGAIHAFTKSLAQSLAQKGIRVNCVSPGPVWTPFIPSTMEPERVSKHGQCVPQGRPAQPEEVAPAFVFFASDADSSFISGEVLTVLGGKTTAA